MGRHHIILDEEKNIKFEEQHHLTKASHLERSKKKLIYILYALAIITFIYLSIDLVQTTRYLHDEVSKGTAEFNQMSSSLPDEYLTTDSDSYQTASEYASPVSESTEESESTEDLENVPIRYMDEDDYPHKKKDTTEPATEPAEDVESISVRLVNRDSTI